LEWTTLSAGYRLNSWLDSAIQALNNRDEASDKFYPPGNDLSVEKELSTF